MLFNIDRKYYSQIRLAAIIFAVLVVLFVLVDFLLFSMKEKQVEVSLAKALIETKNDTLNWKIPLIIKNDLPLGISYENIVVEFGGKRIPLTKNNTIQSGSKDTIYIPLLFLLNAKKDSGTNHSLKINFTVTSFHRSWSFSYAKTISPDAVLEQTKKDAMAAFLEDDNQFTGKYKEENGQVIASIEIKNQSAHTVTISYDKAPILNTGIGKGINATVNPDPKEVKAGETGKMTVIFPHKPEAKAQEKENKSSKSQDSKQTKKYAISGNMVIKVLDLEKTANRRIILEKEAKEEN